MDVDARGLKCPLPIVRLTQAAKKVEAGAELRVVSDDPAFDPDVQAWCRRTGNTLVSVDQADGVITAVVRKEV